MWPWKLHESHLCTEAIKLSLQKQDSSIHPHYGYVCFNGNYGEVYIRNKVPEALSLDWVCAVRSFLTYFNSKSILAQEVLPSYRKWCQPAQEADLWAGEQHVSTAVHIRVFRVEFHLQHKQTHLQQFGSVHMKKQRDQQNESRQSWLTVQRVSET